jgi:hypothetical protein
MPAPDDFVERYVAMWNEPDASARRASVHELWAEDGIHVLRPPQELLDAAVTIGFRNPVLEARGHAELEHRVTRAHDEFVAPGEFRFRAREDVMRLGDVVKFGWEMARAHDNEVVAAGLEFVILDARGRIRADYQFIER